MHFSTSLASVTQGASPMIRQAIALLRVKHGLILWRQGSLRLIRGAASLWSIMGLRNQENLRRDLKKAGLLGGADRLRPAPEFM